MRRGLIVTAVSLVVGFSLGYFISSVAFEIDKQDIFNLGIASFRLGCQVGSSFGDTVAYKKPICDKYEEQFAQELKHFILTN